MSRKRSDNNSASQATRIRELRGEKLNQVREVIATSEAQLRDEYKEKLDKLSLLESVSLGLYEEVDKLSKKSPVERITDLVLTQLNDIIRETKQLVDDDPYIKRLNEFVSAGDNPEQRDAVVMLRQVRQGLERYRQRLIPLASKLRGLIKEAKAIEIALQTVLSEARTMKKDEFVKYGVNLDTIWFDDDYPYYFNLTKLDATDIPSYFAEDK